MDNRPIGVMDSGIGGLTFVKALQKELPNETIIFLGDQARLPYGTKPVEQIQSFCLQIAHFLATFDIKMMVIACNTATAAALPFLQQQLTIPVVGVIQPGSKAALAATRSKRIGVIGTENTINGQAYNQALTQLDNDVVMSGLACQSFVEIVEQNRANDPDVAGIVAQKLSYFETKNIDTLILGCTHFPLLAAQIGAALGDQVTLIDAGKATVGDVTSILNESNQLADAQQAPTKYFTTGQPSKFETVARQWMADDALTAKQVDLGEF